MQMGYMCRETDESTVLVEVTMLDNQFIITNVSACFHDTVIDFKIIVIIIVINITDLWQQW